MFRKMVSCVVLCFGMCGIASAQGYQEYIQYPQYPVRQWQPNVNQVEVNNFNQQIQAPPVAQGWRGQRQADFYHYHEHQWVPQQRNMYDNYCQPQAPQCYQQWQQPQQYSYTPYYYGQAPSFYVPQRSPWRCW